MRPSLPARLPALLLALPFLFLVHDASAQDAAPLTIEQVMADPDWIGPPVENAWWAWDGRQVQYQLKREGSAIRDTYRQALKPAPAEAGGSAAQRVADNERDHLDAAAPAYDAQRQRMAFVRNGDVFVRDLRSGALQQLTRSNDEESQPRFSPDGGVVWRVGN